MHFLKRTFLLLHICCFFKVVGQGCSDGGICTIGSFKPHNQELNKNNISIGTSYGVGDQDVQVITPYLQYQYRFNKKFSVQTKLTYNYASGNLGTASGLGDFYITGIYNQELKNNWRSSFILGTKIFSNQASITLNNYYGNLGIPMVYQTSLGTIDITAGATFYKDNFKFGVGMQIPISGNNLNTFLHSPWESKFDVDLNRNVLNPQYEKALKYPQSNLLTRQADVIANINYHFLKNKPFNFQLGLLTIYHLGEDTYIDPYNNNGSTKPLNIKGSSGFTINGTFTCWYKLNATCTLGLLTGSPFVVREVRPDGLTRHFVIAPELIINF